MKRVKELYDMGIERIKELSPAVESDVKRLLSFFCDVTSLMLIIDKDKEIAKDKVRAYEEALEKRVSGLPVQYITHEQSFMGLDFYVDERVLIPRGETELLVSRVLEILSEKAPSNVMDIGVGSGAICVSVARLANIKTVYGIDISKDALDVAQENAKRIGVANQINFIESNVFEAVPDRVKGTLDLLISNPPYIPPEEMATLHDDVKREPSLALYGGLDGLDFYRQITSEGWDYLKDDGVLVYEVGHDQGDRVAELMLGRGFKRIEFIKDYQGFKRVVIGYKL